MEQNCDKLFLRRIFRFVDKIRREIGHLTSFLRKVKSFRYHSIISSSRRLRTKQKSFSESPFDPLQLTFYTTFCPNPNKKACFGPAFVLFNILEQKENRHSSSDLKQKKLVVFRFFFNVKLLEQEHKRHSSCQEKLFCLNSDGDLYKMRIEEEETTNPKVVLVLF